MQIRVFIGEPQIGQELICGAHLVHKIYTTITHIITAKDTEW